MSPELIYLLLFFVGCGVAFVGIVAVFSCLLAGITNRRIEDAADALASHEEPLEDELFFAEAERQIRRGNRDGGGL